VVPHTTYRVIELIGSSPDLWELAAHNAVRDASKADQDLRVAEVVQMDVVIDRGTIVAFRATLRHSYTETFGSVRP
jgi:flavin-binding protein dodecin